MSKRPAKRTKDPCSKKKKTTSLTAQNEQADATSKTSKQACTSKTDKRRRCFIWLYFHIILDCFRLYQCILDADCCILYKLVFATEIFFFFVMNAVNNTNVEATISLLSTSVVYCSIYQMCRILGIRQVGRHFIAKHL